jgi:hypothetical protein
MPHLPPYLARKWIKEAVSRNGIDGINDGLNRAFACTDDVGLIEEVCIELTKKLFKVCVVKAADAYANHEDFILKMACMWSALIHTLLFPMRLFPPPWEALQLYVSKRDSELNGGDANWDTLANLERATDLILDGMHRSHSSVDFTAFDSVHQSSLLMFALTHCRCREMLLDRLFKCGSKFSNGELYSGAALAAAIRADPGITENVLSQLAYDNRTHGRYGCANVRINGVIDGGTGLHLACREVPARHLKPCLHKLISHLHLNPRILNDNNMTPYQLLFAERITGGTLDDESLQLRACAQLLLGNEVG